MILFTQMLLCSAKGKQILNGSILNEQDLLFKKGEELGKNFTVSISASTREIVRHVNSLKSSGTELALGAALTVAVGIASHSPGTKIMICTGKEIKVCWSNVCAGGKANVGIGVAERDVQFYTTVANEALQKSISIHVIGIEGEDCSLENLGTVADITNGQVEIATPMNLSAKFTQLLNKPVVATNLSCTVLVNKNLAFKREGLFKVTKELGNITVIEQLLLFFLKTSL